MKCLLSLLLVFGSFSVFAQDDFELIGNTLFTNTDKRLEGLFVYDTYTDAEVSRGLVLSKKLIKDCVAAGEALNAKFKSHSGTSEDIVKTKVVELGSFAETSTRGVERWTIYSAAAQWSCSLYLKKEFLDEFTIKESRKMVWRKILSQVVTEYSDPNAFAVIVQQPRFGSFARSTVITLSLK